MGSIWICVVGEGVEKSVEVLGGRCGVGEDICGVGEDKVWSGMEEERERM